MARAGLQYEGVLIDVKREDKGEKEFNRMGPSVRKRSEEVWRRSVGLEMVDTTNNRDNPHTSCVYGDWVMIYE